MTAAGLPSALQGSPVRLGTASIICAAGAAADLLRDGEFAAVSLNSMQPASAGPRRASLDAARADALRRSARRVVLIARQPGALLVLDAEGRLIHRQPI